MKSTQVFSSDGGGSKSLDGSGPGPWPGKGRNEIPISLLAGMLLRHALLRGVDLRVWTGAGRDPGRERAAMKSQFLCLQACSSDMLS